MIVPTYWAEARRQHRARGEQVTVRRFGWSEQSLVEAEALAAARAEEALARLVAGTPLPRREPKVPYNGADGVPIREEVLARVGDTVITRNAYGARCLNTPDVFFADIDHPLAALLRAKFAMLCVGLVGAALVGMQVGSRLVGFTLAVLVLLSVSAVVDAVWRAWLRRRGGAEGLALARIARCVARQPGLGVRVYQTPRGLRVLATSRPFDPGEPVAQELFHALRADPLYVRMCLRQRCFRARLTAKPWRIGIAAHLKPRPGVWPVRPEHLPGREQWVDVYERRAQGFAACRYLVSFGSSAVHPRVGAVLLLHDEACRARDLGLPLA